MTPNKPVIAEEARKLLTGTNSKLDNDMLDMVSRLADVVTYNAEAMNKLVSRVDELEKLVVQQSVQPVIGHPLQVLLAQPHVQRVKCVKSTSHMWKEGKDYPVLINTSDITSKIVRSETGKQLRTSRSLFVAVKEQREPFKQPFKLDFYGNTPTSLLTKEQRLSMFLEQTRMFVGLPTIHLIKPRSL